MKIICVYGQDNTYHSGIFKVIDIKQQDYVYLIYLQKDNNNYIILSQEHDSCKCTNFIDKGQEYYFTIAALYQNIDTNYCVTSIGLNDVIKIPLEIAFNDNNLQFSNKVYFTNYLKGLCYHEPDVDDINIIIKNMINMIYKNNPEQINEVLSDSLLYCDPQYKLPYVKYFNYGIFKIINIKKIRSNIKKFDIAYIICLEKDNIRYRVFSKNNNKKQLIKIKKNHEYFFELKSFALTMYWDVCYIGDKTPIGGYVIHGFDISCDDNCGECKIYFTDNLHGRYYFLPSQD